MGFLFISLSILSFGLSNSLWVYPLRQFTFLQVIVLRSILTSILFGITWLLTMTTSLDFGLKETVQITDVGIAILISSFSFFGLYFYVKSLKLEKVSLAVPVSSISGVFGILTGVVIFKESVSVQFIAACAFVLAGVNLVNEKSYKTLRLSKGVWYNVLAAFFWGVSFALFQFSVKSLGAILFSFVLELTVFVFSASLLRMQNIDWNIHPVKGLINRNILILGVLGFAGVIFYNLALLHIAVTQASLFSVLTPMISVIAAYFLFRERLSTKQYIGIVLIIAALVLINLK